MTACVLVAQRIAVERREFVAAEGWQQNETRDGGVVPGRLSVVQLLWLGVRRSRGVRGSGRLDDDDSLGHRAAAALFHVELDEVARSRQAAAIEGGPMDVNVGMAGAHDEAVMLLAVVPLDQPALAAGGGQQASAGRAVQRLGCVQQFLLLAAPHKGDAAASAVEDLVLVGKFCHCWFPIEKPSRARRRFYSYRSESDARPSMQLREATAGFEPAIGVLQTPALPLGYVATIVPVGYQACAEMSNCCAGHGTFGAYPASASAG